MISTQTKLISKIVEYRKIHTLEQTGVKFSLTGERIRQLILTKHQRRCPVHNRLYYNKCSFCHSKDYKKWAEKLDMRFLMVEIEKEAKNRKRDWLSTERKRYLIRRLHDKEEKSFAEIARLLNRDYSSVTNLYESNTK